MKTSPVHDHTLRLGFALAIMAAFVTASVQHRVSFSFFWVELSGTLIHRPVLNVAFLRVHGILSATMRV